jgi:hypothetical protein
VRVVRLGFVPPPLHVLGKLEYAAGAPTIVPSDLSAHSASRASCVCYRYAAVISAVCMVYMNNYGVLEADTHATGEGHLPAFLNGAVLIPLVLIEAMAAVAQAAVSATRDRNARFLLELTSHRAEEHISFAF